MPLAEVPGLAPRILNGEVRGRVVDRGSPVRGLIKGKYRDNFDPAGVSQESRCG